MTHRVRQLKDDSELTAPVRPLAVVEWEPYRFGKEGIRFQRDVDNLDELDWALLQIGRYLLLLQHHVGSPTRGTEVLAPENANGDDSLDALLQAFKLSSDALLWLAPDMERSRWRRYSAE